MCSRFFKDIFFDDLLIENVDFLKIFDFYKIFKGSPHQKLWTLESKENKEKYSFQNVLQTTIRPGHPEMFFKEKCLRTP